MEIGAVIRKYRKEKEMTQEEMAGCLGVTASAVNKWENGKYRKEKEMTQEEMAGCLGVTASAVNKWENGVSQTKGY